ncbi:hypothetical protein Dimus_012549 [Dionaea muscipula]
MHHKVNIKKFTLDIGLNDGRVINVVTSWIAAAVSRGVEELKLSFWGVLYDCALPRCLFFSQTLVTLILSAETSFLVIPSSVWLPSLKILDMSGILFSNSSSLTRLFNGCPLLQDLTLDSCIWETGQVYYFPAAMLRRLRIVTNRPDSGYPTVPKIEFGVPKLELFEFCGDVSELYCIYSSSALANAKIAVGERSEWDLVISLISSLSNVTRVKLSYPRHEEWPDCMDDGYSSLRELPIFRNLSIVEVNLFPWEPWSVGWRLLHHLLSNSPNMETLVFRKGFQNKDCRDFIKEFVQSQTFTGASNLKVIRVHGFSGSAEEVEMVTWLLRKAIQLKQLNLHVDEATDDRFDHYY